MTRETNTENFSFNSIFSVVTVNTIQFENFNLWIFILQICVFLIDVCISSLILIETRIIKILSLDFLQLISVAGISSTSKCKKWTFLVFFRTQIFSLYPYNILINLFSFTTKYMMLVMMWYCADKMDLPNCSYPPSNHTWWFFLHCM